MKVYKFKCKDCGSKSYEKLDDHTYKCKYCGQIEEVYLDESIEEENNKINESENLSNNETETQSQTKSTFSRTIARKNVSEAFVKFLVCLIVGVLGAHKFMEGKIFTGIIYFFTGGLFGIGYIIDCVKHGIEFANVYNDERNKVEINEE